VSSRRSTRCSGFRRLLVMSYSTDRAGAQMGRPLPATSLIRRASLYILPRTPRDNL
jgi:hypothetical protein